MNARQNHLSRSEQTTSSTRSHRNSLTTAPQNDLRTTLYARHSTSQTTIRSSHSSQQNTPSRNRSRTQNSNLKYLQTLVCLPNRSGGPSGDGLAGGCAGGAR